MALRFVSIVCSSWKRGVARRFIYILYASDGEEEWLVGLYLLCVRSGKEEWLVD